MGKKRRRAAQPRGAASEPRTPASEPRTPASESRTPASEPQTKPAAAKKPTRLEPAPAPVFFFGYEVAWAKLVLARWVLFLLLAIDSLLQLSHAPRYGAGGFNVAQLPFLDELGPGRVGYTVGQLACSYFLVLAACGVATRVVVPIATALYAWMYFGSQLDSYQHHYLVALVLLLACFVPWERPVDAHPATPVRTWALRLIVIQLAVLYFWAAVSKMSTAWLDGRTLSEQIAGPARTLIVDTVGFKRAAWFTMLVELVLAATIWCRPAWWIALPLGLGFHITIVYTGLEIGLFAWLMLGFYLLVVPDRAWVWLAETGPLRAFRDGLRMFQVSSPVVAWGIALVALALGVVLASFTRFPYAVAVTAVVTVVLVALATIGRRAGLHVAVAAAAFAHVLALVVWVSIDRSTDQAADYYRFWGGSSRRLNNPEAAERAYRKLVEVDPAEPAGHYGLGVVLLARGGDDDTAIAALRAAQELEPKRARAWIAEAEWLRKQGRIAEAIERARGAVTAEPSSKEAAALLSSLTGGAAPTAPSPSPTPSPSPAPAPPKATATDDEVDPT